MCFIATSNLLTRLLVYSSTTHIIKFKVQCSKFKVNTSANCFQHSPSLSERGLGGEVPPIGYIYVK